MNQNTLVNRMLSLLLLFALLVGILPTGVLGAEQEELAPVRQTQTLADRAATLLATISSLPAGGDYNGQVNLNKIESKPLMNGMRGSYYLLHRDSPASGGYAYYILDGRVTTTDGTVPAVSNLTMPSTTISIRGGVTPDMAINLVPYGDNGSVSQYFFVMGANKDKLLGITTDGKVPATLEKRSTSGTPLLFCHDSTSGWAFHIRQTVSEQDYGLVFDATNLYFSWTQQSQHTDIVDTRMNLYRLWSTTALREAIDEVTTFLNTPDAYSEELYGEFLDTLDASITLFTKRNSFPTEALWLEDYYQEELDRQTNALLSYATLLGSTTEYIDIPIEILDFRADRFLFQNMGGFSLRFDYRDFAPGTSKYRVFSQIPELPGELDPPLTSLLTGDNSNYIRTGLTKPKLLNGKPVYEEQTIAHVAKGILVHTGGSFKNQALGWNSKFYDMQQAGLTLGSWEETKKKIVDENGVVTGKNGDHLPWTSVTTAFDLAYYMLNYLWAPVPQTDAELLDGTYRYNIPVPERQIMRLYKDSTTGNYLLDAEDQMGYSGKYILNAPGAQIGKTESSHPCFAPIEGLGFETPGVMDDNYDTDSSGYTAVLAGHDAVDSNFLFTMHARGAFIYSEKENQYFDFRGDDDVYFFVNDTLALDMGAAHERLERGLYLNDVADALGLVDGETYDFDMFYAERNPSKANLRFETNIQIVSRDGKTGKVQYAHTEDGENLVSEATGLGKFIENRQTINVGEVVAYGFGILNDQQSPLTNVSFRDDSLGVNISPDSLTLCDTENGFRKNNGLETAIDDIRVYYRSHTDGVVSTDDPQELTYEALDAILDGGDSVFTGSYFVRMENEWQLKALLQRGIPVGCQMLVYGFLRRTGIEDLSYTNTVKSLCYYIPHGQNTTYPVIGEASCQLRVPENSSLPQVRKLEVVLDYGKAVSVPLIEIPDLIHFEDGSFARVGEVKGFLTESYNGELLKTLPNDHLSAQPETQFKGVHGTFTVEEDVLTYQPTQFLDRVETLYAVVELQDFYSAENNTGAYSYVVAELRFIPATVMYYETDFADNIFTLKQEGGGTPWQTDAKDGTDAADPNQDYERLNGTVYHTDIAREYIPAEAFFVDFDGEGYERRYRDNPQYSGIDFDKETAWYSHNVRNTIYNKHALNSAAGTMELTNLTSTNEKGESLGAWIQTMIPGEDIGSESLRLFAGEGHYAQIRFRVENCDFYAGSGNISLFFSNSKDEETDGDIAIEPRRSGRVALSNDEVLTGDYMTVRIPLDYKPYYENSETIDTIRLYIAGYTDDGTGKGKITIDYIYIGPEMGMEDDVYGNYLFVGFDGNPADELRYGSSVYGANTSGKTYRDLDNASAWVSASAQTTIKILTGLENDPKNGYIYFEDKLDDSTLDDDDSKNYNYIHAGSFVDSNDSSKGFNLPIAYTPTMNDFCQIRLKIENAALVWDAEKNTYLIPSVGIEFEQGLICGRGNLDASQINSGFHTITFPLDAPYWKKHWNESGDVLQWLHPIVYNLKGNSSYTGAKFTIDYIFIGPEHLLDRVSQHVSPEADKVNHLFFDFNNNDAAKLRYTNPVYGETVTNYDLSGNWSVDTNVGDTVIESFDSVGGTITFKDNNDERWNYIHSAKNFYDTPLAYTPGTNDYLRIRMKINKGSTGTASTGLMTVSLDNFEGENFFSYGSEPYPFADYADGEYHIFTVPLDTEDYLKEDLLTAVRPVISGTQNCSFTVDYIYVGPLTESNPTAPSLYFGFGNRGSGHWNTDSLRYDSDTYGFLNYDTNHWLSESEAVASTLTQEVYGWKTAGNEDRGDPVKDEIKDYVPPFPPTEDVSYPNIAVTPRTDTGNLELVVDVEEGKTADVIAIQTYPSVTSPRYYWRHFMQMLNYHPAQENIVQIRFKTEGLTIGKDFAVKLMYLPTGADSFITSAPLQPAPLKELNPEEDYVILTAQLDDTFNNAPAIERLRLVFEGVTAEKGDKILIDYVYAGVGRIAPEPVYGYDSSYLNDPMLSNGSSFTVEGQGVKVNDKSKTYTEASFNFVGTGFDIISRTGPNQATIRVAITRQKRDEMGQIVYDENHQPVMENVKTLTVNNKGELDLYQIPIVSVQGLAHGEYTVTIWVNKAITNSSYDALNRGGTFHFDAVRIYDPMGKSGNTPELPQIAYLTDREAYPHIKEIRNILLSAPDFATLTGAGTGAIFVDAKTDTESIPATDANGETTNATEVVELEGIEVTDHYTLSVETYNKIGPKNEVYLAPGQAVAFKLQISTTLVPDSVDVGVKIIETGTSANLVASIVTQGTDEAKPLEIASLREATISSATAQYYALPIDANDYFEEGNSRYCYIVLYNKGTVGNRTNVLSLTDIKVAYDTLPEIGLPEDAPKDPEIKPNPTESTTAPSTEATPQSIWELTPEKRTAGTYFDFVVDGQTPKAAALVMKAVLETPVLAEGGKIGHSLNLASDIAINYVVSKADLADYDSFYLECLIPGQQEALRIDPVEKDGYYYFTLEGLTAVQMGDVITATLYMKKDGRVYYWEADHYSIAQYAYGQLDKERATPALKTLCADLLRYGASAQIYKSYRTNDLVDGAMTVTHRTYLSDINGVTFGNTNVTLNDLSNPAITWVGKSLNLESKVTLKFAFSIAGYSGKLEDLNLRISYTNIEGKTVTTTVEKAEIYNTDRQFYTFSFDGLLAAELRSVVSVQVYEKDTPVSCTVQYSADTYGNNKTGTLETLCKALFAYSDSAESYFTN